MPRSTAARKRQLSAWLTWPIHERTLALISTTVPFRLVRVSFFTYHRTLALRTLILPFV
jgi:hypothetical protein